MSDSKLQAVVREIRAQLAGAKDLNPETRRSLESLVQDLEAVASRPPGEAAAPRACRSASRTPSGGSRPRIPVSSTLGNVVDALAFFGL